MENTVQGLGLLGALPQELLTEMLSYLTFDGLIKVFFLSKAYQAQVGPILQKTHVAMQAIIEKPNNSRGKIIEKAKQDAHFAIAGVYYKPFFSGLFINEVIAITIAHPDAIKNKIFNQALYQYLESLSLNYAEILVKEGAKPDQKQLNRLLVSLFEQLKYEHAKESTNPGRLVYISLIFQERYFRKKLIALGAQRSNNEYFNLVIGWCSKMKVW